MTFEMLGSLSVGWCIGSSREVFDGGLFPGDSLLLGLDFLEQFLHSFVVVFLYVKANLEDKCRFLVVFKVVKWG